jgi:hypothetical protein
MKKLIALVCVAGGVGIAAKGCLSKTDPDEQLASRLQDLCEIARANVKTPNDGVTALGAYLGDHAGDMYKSVIDTVSLVVQITDEKKHDRRAELARERWGKTVGACAADWMEFAEAVENDPIATERIEKFQKRLERTIDQLFGGGALRDLPSAFQRYLTTTFQPAPSVPSPVPPPGAS